MKMAMMNISRAALVLASVVTGCPLLLSAADPTAPPEARPSGGVRTVRGPAGGMGGGMNVVRTGMNFGLDDQQMQLFREALQKSQADLNRLEQKLRSAEKELLQAVLAENADEKIVREKAEAVSKIQVEMTVLRSQALATVAPTLKPEQREEMVNGRLGAMLLNSSVGMGNVMVGPGGRIVQRAVNPALTPLPPGRPPSTNPPSQ